MQQRIEIPLDSTKFSPDSHRTEEYCWEPPNNRFINGHGYGLGTPGEDSGTWPAALEQWLRGIGFILPAP